MLECPCMEAVKRGGHVTWHSCFDRCRCRPSRARLGPLDGSSRCRSKISSLLDLRAIARKGGALMSCGKRRGGRLCGVSLGSFVGCRHTYMYEMMGLGDLVLHTLVQEAFTSNRRLSAPLQTNERGSTRAGLFMIAGHRSAIAAWYVAGSLLLRCCCRCYSFSFGSHALLSRTTATSTKNIGVGSLHRRRRNGRPWSSGSPRQAPSVRRIRTSVGVVGGDGVGEVAGAAARAAEAALVLPRPIVRVVLPEGRGLRVHSMSDLHTDSSANAAW